MKCGNWIPMDSYKDQPLDWHYRICQNGGHEFVEVTVAGVGTKGPVKLLPGLGQEGTAEYVVGELIKKR
jgi:hypothetical protein